MKTYGLGIGVMAAGLSAAFAETGAAGWISAPPDMASAFDSVRHPMTNSTLFDLAVPRTEVRPFFIHQSLPNTVSIAGGGQVPMGGDAQIVALQFEIAFTDRLSLIALKDGYITIDAGNQPTWSDESGFANLAAGLKYAFILDEANGFALAGTAMYELPTGNDDVFQGEGAGSLNLGVQAVKLWDRFQLAGALGANLSVDGEMSSSSFISTHASYEVSRWFMPLVEMNWFHVLEPGDGNQAFNTHVGGAVPAVAAFEGNDLINFGASSAGENRDLVTAAVGFRSRVLCNLDLGLAYEFPLSDKNDGLIESRWMLDAVWTF